MSHCLVLEAHQKPTDKPTRRIKRSGGQSLVRSGLAIWIVENVLLIMRRSKAIDMCSKSTPNADLGRRSSDDQTPGQSPRMGKLKWEPPKSKRQLKAHPWQNMNPITEQRKFA